ncbi:O-antigen ligase like membrane protein [Marinitoga hydrogenitolerans DSM 16785]|uniref:O-antigen ligase like membrane protein n=1 Tax=Marinitoga hydrogenitolerans (strain DSM 16785 / JCM 12826 / AT1271) TaxID=1122195 RepID=A0A1M4Y4A5_MARH1|nr:O-antigen polymerase [Marinitoga hydrogenitolerans]SHF00519.1 O-antigen ligase like membrane protein [Marinitoga hydrogenitolerans DSM 16785]
MNFSLLNFFIYVSLLFISADRISINLPIGNVRIVQFFLIIAFIILFSKINIKIEKENAFIFLILVFYFFINIIFSYNKLRTISYLIWIIYNYIFIFLLFSNYIYNFKFENFEKRFLLIYRIISYYVFIQFFFGLLGISDPFFGTNFTFGVPRPYIWMYEPSYLATYLTPYFIYSNYNFLINKDMDYSKDSKISTFALIFTTSTSGYLLMLLFALFIFSYYLINLKIKKVFKILSYLVIILLFVIVLSLIFVPELFNYFFLRLFKLGIRASAPERVSKWFETLRVIKDNFLIGVGAGAYGTYVSNNIKDVASNITLEIMAELGFYGFFIISILLIQIFKPLFFSIQIRKEKKLMALFWSIIFLIIILQSNQNYLRLYLWAQISYFYGYILMLKEKYQ